jgi:hypothetical protein
MKIDISHFTLADSEKTFGGCFANGRLFMAIIRDDTRRQSGMAMCGSNSFQKPGNLIWAPQYGWVCGNSAGFTENPCRAAYQLSAPFDWGRNKSRYLYPANPLG